MLICLVGLFVLNTTTEARVVHGYIWALLIADVGHVGATVWVMGSDAAIDFQNWVSSDEFTSFTSARRAANSSKECDGLGKHR